MKQFALLFFVSICFLTSCLSAPTQQETPIEQPSTSLPAQTQLLTSHTTLPLDGNRLAVGQGDIPNLRPTDIELAGVPQWVTAVSYQDGILWVAVLEDGQAEGFLLKDGKQESVAITPSQLPAGMPPLLIVADDQPQFVLPAADYSPLTNPILLNSAGDLAYINRSGDLIISQAGKVTTVAVNAQPDARILMDENGRLLLNTDPTEQYPHGIMGDRLEAGSLTLVATQPQPEIIRQIPMASGWVMESIAPIWVDFDGDGVREISVTRSNAQQGAQQILLNEQGELLATGPAIGNGNRWRHQLAIAPFAPDGTLELVEVRTPHIGGPTNFYQWQGDTLAIVAEARGYTSHAIGSRNLDMGIAGHFDTSGLVTLILPTQARDALGGIQHMEGGAAAAWSLGLNGRLSTNIAAITLPTGELAIGVGQDSASLRIWQP